MNVLQSSELFKEINSLGRQGDPFIFLIDAFAEKGWTAKLDDASAFLWFSTPLLSAFPPPVSVRTVHDWIVTPPAADSYKDGFDLVMEHIRRGDSFLLNYTRPSLLETQLSLEDIFYLSHARYKVYLQDVFTCFSPETFVTINADGLISSHPMKGTAEANQPLAEEKLLSDSKEIAEHHTIVDLIRNDLSRVARDVKLEKFRYTERIHTNRQDLIQVSSLITGRLPASWKSALGDIFRELLPAGSVTGAPKARTIEIIRKAEGYDRGWYTGIFGVFDGSSVDSAVLIRFVEKTGDGLIFKSGGGITFQSNWENEYLELIKKVYVPIA